MSKKTNKQELENIYFTLTGTRVQFKTILECLQNIYLAYGGTEQLKDTNAEMLALITTVAKAGGSELDPAIVKYGEVIDEKTGIKGLYSPIMAVDDYAVGSSNNACSYFPEFWSEIQNQNNAASLFVKNNLKFINEKIMANPKITGWQESASFRFFSRNDTIFVLPDFKNLTNINGLFNSYSGTEIPNFQTSLDLNDMKGAFFNCTNIKSVPMFYRPGTDFNKEISCMQAFAGCNALVDISSLSKIKIKDAYLMFDKCNSLIDASNLVFSSEVGASRIFSDCSSLEKIPDFSHTILNKIEGAFNRCKKLTKIEGLNTSKVTDFSLTFYECEGLITLCDLNLSNMYRGSGYGGTNMFSGCVSLTTLTDNPNAPEGSRWQFRGSVSFGSCPLDKASILKVFNGLTTAYEGYTITISSVTNSYLSDADKAIAINKEWTIIVQ